MAESVIGLVHRADCRGHLECLALDRNFSAICTDRDDFRIDLFHCRAEGVSGPSRKRYRYRAFEPQERNLAAIKTGEVAYALTDCETLPFLLPIAGWRVAEENAISPTCGGRTKTRRNQIVVTVNRQTALLDLVLSGAGIAVLPCFVGRCDARLTREGEELGGASPQSVDRHEQRRSPPPRYQTVADRMTVSSRCIPIFMPGAKSRPA